MEISNLRKEIQNLVTSANFPNQLKKNIELVDSIPGIGELTAVILVAEIGDIDGFLKPKHLFAFFIIDCSVNESGKFKGKKAKVALVAIMHKILNFIFAILRNQTPFEERDPKLHKQMFLKNKALSNVT